MIVLVDLGYHVQMRDLHPARGSTGGHYNDRGGARLRCLSRGGDLAFVRDNLGPLGQSQPNAPYNGPFAVS